MPEVKTWVAASTTPHAAPTIFSPVELIDGNP